MSSPSTTETTREAAESAVPAGESLSSQAMRADKLRQKMEVDVDIRAIFGMLNRRKGIIAGVTLCVFFVGLLIAFLQTPLYTAEAVLQLNSKPEQVLDIEAVLSGLPPEEAAVQSEIDVIRSRNLLRRVVIQQKLVNNADFNPLLNDPSLVSSLKSWTRDLLGMESKEMEGKELQEFTLRVLVDKLRDNLIVTSTPRSLTIKVLYTDRNPELATQVANAVADQYLVNQLETRFDATRRASTWLESRLDELRGNVVASEQAVQEFSEEHDLIALDGQQTVNDQQLAELSSQLIIARTDLAQTEARLNQARQVIKSRGAETLPEVLDSQLIQRLREQEAEVARSVSDLETKYGPRHPLMIKAKAELRDLRGKIGLEMDKIVQGLQNEAAAVRSRVQALESSLDELRDRQSASSEAEVQLAELMRQRDANRTLYESFLERFKETSETEGMQQFDARIISTAEVPLNPSYPRKALIIAVALVVGAGLGLGLALIVEHLDNGFRSTEQIESHLMLPAIGMVPALNRRVTPKDYVVKHPTSIYAESLRSIMTAVHFSNPDRPPRTLMIMSSVPSEGKSEFAISLARMLAKSGSKVLLLDCDLRRPTVAKSFGEVITYGLSHVLTGEARASDAVLTDAETGLHYIGALENTPNSQELLGSQRMRQFIDSMRSRYDYIIMDTPPVMALSDALMLSRVADSAVYLVRWGRTPRSLVRNAVKQLMVANIRLAGVVLSRVDLEKHRQYQFGDHGHYYGNYKAYYNG